MQPKSSSTGKSAPTLPDVAKPGESAPSATSKPVIVGHKIEVQDPTLVVKKPEEPADPTTSDPLAATPESSSLTHAEKTIQPLNDMKELSPEPEPETIEPEEESNDSMQAISAAESKAEAEAKSPEPEAGTSEKPEPETPAEAASSESSAVGAVADQVGANKAQQKKAEEEAKRRKELEKMIDSKQYFVSIGETKNQRSIRIFLIFLLIFLIGLELAIDAGLLGSDLKPLVDII